MGIGACLFDPANEVTEFFGAQAGDALVGIWADRRDQQVIAQAELVPTLVALSTWGQHVRGRPVVVYIDNDSARYGLISGYSPVLASASLISTIWGLLAQLRAAAWFARVPTVCNPADGPSRGRFDEMNKVKGARLVSPSFLGARGPTMWSAIARRLGSEVPTAARAMST